MRFYGVALLAYSCPTPHNIMDRTNARRIPEPIAYVIVRHDNRIPCSCNLVETFERKVYSKY